MLIPRLQSFSQNIFNSGLQSFQEKVSSSLLNQVDAYDISNGQGLYAPIADKRILFQPLIELKHNLAMQLSSMSMDGSQLLLASGLLLAGGALIWKHFSDQFVKKHFFALRDVATLDQQVLNDQRSDVTSVLRYHKELEALENPSFRFLPLVSKRSLTSSGFDKDKLLRWMIKKQALDVRVNRFSFDVLINAFERGEFSRTKEDFNLFHLTIIKKLYSYNHQYLSAYHRFDILKMESMILEIRKILPKMHSLLKSESYLYNVENFGDHPFLCKELDFCAELSNRYLADLEILELSTEYFTNQKEVLKLALGRERFRLS